MTPEAEEQVPAGRRGGTDGAPTACWRAGEGGSGGASGFIRVSACPGRGLPGADGFTLDPPVPLGSPDTWRSLSDPPPRQALTPTALQEGSCVTKDRNVWPQNFTEQTPLPSTHGGYVCRAGPPSRHLLDPGGHASIHRGPGTGPTLGGGVRPPSRAPGPTCPSCPPKPKLPTYHSHSPKPKTAPPVTPTPP